MTFEARFFPPSTIPTPETPPPELKTTDYVGDWHLNRTSNGFWKDKRDVRMRYTDSGDDQFSYSAGASSAEKLMKGRNLLVPGKTNMFSWQGTGLMRLFGLKWEILGLEYQEGGQGEWLVTFQHKTIFTSPAINVACRSIEDPSEDVLKSIEAWILSLGDAELAAAVRNMYVVAKG